MIQISDVRATLGNAYSSKPSDEVIALILQRRKEELQTLIKKPIEEETNPHLKKWLLNMVCADVLAWDLIGIDSADAIDYTIDVLRESKAENVKLKLEWIKILKETAYLALRNYFINLVGYRTARL